MDTVIQVSGLSKTFEYYEKEEGLKGSVHNLFHRKQLRKEAVIDQNFSVQRGEFVGFLGPNGAGKTTSLKMLSGILYPTSGEANVLGYVPWERKNEYKRRISIVMGQKNQLWWDLPAIDSMNLSKKIYGLGEAEYKNKLDEMVELLNVEDLLKVQVRRLSLGERMKMELIAALLHNPDVVFLDEPTIGLDVIAQKNIRAFLKKYNKENQVTILLTSHYMDDILDLCERSIVINHGKVIFDDKTEQIRNLMGEKKRIKLQGEGIKNEELSAYGVVREQEDGTYILEVEQKKVSEITIELLKRYQLNDFSIEDMPIEDGITLLYQSM